MTLDKNLSLKDLERIREGIVLDDGEIKADSLHYADTKTKREVQIEIHSGRNRLVRRIFEHLGYEIVKLDRTYYAGLTKKNLPRGMFRPLTRRGEDAQAFHLILPSPGMICLSGQISHTTYL